jgi:1-acyl-sn-glycerol-3-phosphate acyltransferase
MTENVAPSGAEARARRTWAGALLRAFGWRAVFAPLPGPKGIVVLYPHTSNWDFIVGVLYKLSFRLKVQWVGKDSLFRWPLRRLFVGLGGIPVNRRERSGVVAALLAQFAQRDWMWLVVAPEGTRARTDHWKSGFYQLAVATGLPVALGFMDYATRTVGIDTYLTMSGDTAQDLARIRAFYAGKRGRRPQNEGIIQLRN